MTPHHSRHNRGLLVTKIEKQAFKEQRNFKKVMLLKNLNRLELLLSQRQSYKSFTPCIIKNIGKGLSVV